MLEVYRWQRSKPCLSVEIGTAVYKVVLDGLEEKFVSSRAFVFLLWLEALSGAASKH